MNKDLPKGIQFVNLAGLVGATAGPQGLPF